MRIAFLSYYNGINFRGVETFVHELGNRLTGMGHKITVFQYGPEIKNTRYNVGSLATTYSLPDLLLPDNDIIFPLNGRFQSVRAKIWARNHHKKIVISGQSGPGWDDILNLYTFPDAFIGLTDHQCRWAKKINPGVKTVNIPNGVDIGVFHPGVTPLVHHLPHPVVLYVAAMDPVKRHELLVRAVAKTNASLLLVGNGSPSEQLTDLCQNLLPGRCQIIALTYRDMPSVYTACDLFAYPTFPRESFGIAMLEAMASGLAVVAADDPIRREIVGDAGVFVDPEDTGRFTASLMAAINTKWGTKPVARAARYNWDKITVAYSELFTGLLKPV
jgi:glycosyltransferase involved in cell wall biosynthesis